MRFGTQILGSIEKLLSERPFVQLSEGEQMGRWVYRTDAGIVRIVCERLEGDYEENVHPSFNYDGNRVGHTVHGPHGHGSWYEGKGHPERLYELRLGFPVVKGLVATEKGLGLLLEDLGTPGTPKPLSSDEAWKLLQDVVEILGEFHGRGGEGQGHGDIRPATVFACTDRFGTLKWRLAYPSRGMDLPGCASRGEHSWAGDLNALGATVAEMIEPTELVHPLWRNLINLLLLSDPGELPSYEALRDFLKHQGPNWTPAFQTGRELSKSSGGRDSTWEKIKRVLLWEVTPKNILGLFTHRGRALPATHSDIEVHWDDDQLELSAEQDGFVLWTIRKDTLKEYKVVPEFGLTLLISARRYGSFVVIAVDNATGITRWVVDSFDLRHGCGIHGSVLASYDSSGNFKNVVDLRMGIETTWSSRLPQRPALASVNTRWLAAAISGEIIVCDRMDDYRITRFKSRIPTWMEVHGGKRVSVTASTGLFSPDCDVQPFPPSTGRLEARYLYEALDQQ